MQVHDRGSFFCNRLPTRNLLTLPHVLPSVIARPLSPRSRGSAGTRAQTWVCKVDEDRDLVPQQTQLPTATAAGLLSLGSGSGQARVFGALSATSGLLAAAALFAPESLLDFLLPEPVTAYGSYGPLDPIYLRFVGASMIVSAAAEYCLMDAAANNRLKSATYQRLMLGCALKSIGFLTAFTLSPDLWTPQLTALYPTAALASVLVNAAVLTSVNGGLKAPDVGLSNLVPKSPGAWVYTVFTLIYLASAAGCYAPLNGQALFEHGVEGSASLLLRHTGAPNMLLAAVACINLRDAAERSRLGAGTFKRLNLGLATMEIVSSVLFVGAMTVRAAPSDFGAFTHILTSLSISSFCLWHYLWAKK